VTREGRAIVTFMTREGRDEQVLPVRPGNVEMSNCYLCDQGR